MNSWSLPQVDCHLESRLRPAATHLKWPKLETTVFQTPHAQSHTGSAFLFFCLLNVAGVSLLVCIPAAFSRAVPWSLLLEVTAESSLGSGLQDCPWWVHLHVASRVIFLKSKCDHVTTYFT